uniref:Helix-turn-helix conjugative transposon-like domain-containing protein n=1 Tax=Fervidobacterium pennivorans TaxID=93466 RepID=A0A7V4NEK7_FERPE
MKKRKSDFPLLLYYGKSYRKLSRDEEKQLIERWKKGDWEAFERLLQAYAPLIIHGALRFSEYFGLEVNDETEAEMLDIFIKCLKHYNPEKTRLSTYIMTFIKNHFRAIAGGAVNRQKFEITFTDYKNKKEENRVWQIKPRGLLQYKSYKSAKGRGDILERIWKLIKRLPKKEKLAAEIFVELVLFDEFDMKKFIKELFDLAIGPEEAENLLAKVKDYLAKNLSYLQSKEEFYDDAEHIISPLDD